MSTAGNFTAITSSSNTNEHRRDSAKYFDILAGLIAFVFFGFHSNWKFGITKTSQDDHQVFERIPESTTETNSEESKIQFPSISSVARTGVKTALLEQRGFKNE